MFNRKAAPVADILHPDIRLKLLQALPRRGDFAATNQRRLSPHSRRSELSLAYTLAAAGAAHCYGEQLQLEWRVGGMRVFVRCVIMLL